MEATRLFADLQTAYEVLSDPHERSWYDSHRDAILSGQDGDSADMPTYRNVKLTSVEEIMSLIRRFNSTVPFDDEPTGFYGIARETFEHLALEEEAASDADGTDCPDLPTFGVSDDSYNNVVKPFYSSWTSFSTCKSFSWKDKYRLSDAPDRRVRRMMEKENKKLREDAIREFNDTVRFLVTFVRKRDPRYMPNSQTNAERQASMRSAAAAQAARSRAANQERFTAQEIADWAQPTSQDPKEGGFSESEYESDVELLECIVCDKTFKSEKQFEAHERSKKHIKALQSLRRQMKKEGVDLDLGTTVKEQPSHGGDTIFTEHIVAKTSLSSNETQAHLQDDNSDQATAPTEDRGKSCSATDHDSEHSPAEADWEDDGYAPRSAVMGRLSSTPPDDTDAVLALQAQNMAVKDDVPKRKMGMAKAKRDRKAAQASEQVSSSSGPRISQYCCSSAGGSLCFWSY